MWQWVKRHTGHPRLRQITLQVCSSYGASPDDPASLAWAVQRFSQDRIRYIRQHPPEYVVSPLWTIAWRAGDCNSKATLICCMLRSFGIRCRWRFLRIWAREGGRITHVVPDAWIGASWVCLESVRRVPYGYDPAPTLARLGRLRGTHAIGDLR